jgi:hypothetical protein
MPRDKYRFIFIKSPAKMADTAPACPPVPAESSGDKEKSQKPVEIDKRNRNESQAPWGNRETASVLLAVVLWAIPMPIGHERIVLLVRMALVALALLYPLFQLPLITRDKTKLGKISIGVATIVGMFVVLAFYTWLIWPPMRRHALSQVERRAFEDPLKELRQPKTSIHFYCAPSDEVDCEYATDLIPLFGEAGWDVSTTVDRITLSRPKSGITIGLHGTVKAEDEPKLKWNQGEWTTVTPEEEAVRQAFVNIKIEPDSTSGAVIPENQINIYVGHEREDESIPTDMTRAFEAIAQMRREHPERFGKPKVTK